MISYFPLNTLETVVGRDPDCDIRLRFVQVSRRHARVLWNETSNEARLLYC